MARAYKTSKHLDRVLTKLGKKDKKLFESVLKKMQEVCTTPDVEHYKNLKYSLKAFKRVHIAGSFVLVFKYDKTNDLLYFTDFDHHDRIYTKQY